MSKRSSKIHVIRYNSKDLSKGWPVEVSFAKTTVMLTRVESDVFRSRAGTTIGCVNSMCAVRLGAENVFTHPVFFADFMKTSVYIVDKLNKYGQPAHAVLYKHNDGAGVDLNDHIQPRMKLLAALNMQKVVVLQPPVSRAGIKNPSAIGINAGGTGPRDKQTPRRRAVPKGAIRRAIEAGLLPR